MSKVGAVVAVGGVTAPSVGPTTPSTLVAHGSSTPTVLRSVVSTAGAAATTTGPITP